MQNSIRDVALGFSAAWLIVGALWLLLREGLSGIVFAVIYFCSAYLCIRFRRWGLPSSIVISIPITIVIIPILFLLLPSYSQYVNSPITFIFITTLVLAFQVLYVAYRYRNYRASPASNDDKGKITDTKGKNEAQSQSSDKEDSDELSKS